MTPERWREVVRLYEAAKTLGEAERPPFLERECSDPEIRAEVLRLLGVSSVSETGPARANRARPPMTFPSVKPNASQPPEE